MSRNRRAFTDWRIIINATSLPLGDEKSWKLQWQIDFVRNLIDLIPSCQWKIMTSNETQSLFMPIQRPNMEVVHLNWKWRILQNPPIQEAISRYRKNLSEKAILLAAKIRGLNSLLREFYRWKKKPPIQDNFDLWINFSSIPFFPSKKIPSISIIDFFQFYKDAFQTPFNDLYQILNFSTITAFFSEYERKMALESFKIQPNKIFTIPFRLFAQVNQPIPDEVSKVMRKYSLKENPFLLYPAEFLPYKNHEMLILAFRIFVSRNPETPINLVLAGKYPIKVNFLKEIIRRIGLENKVFIISPISEPEIRFLLAGCHALIFPSLHEGIPFWAIEGLVNRKRILCSKDSGFLEHLHDAAIYFDPRKPEEISRIIELMTKKRNLMADWENKAKHQLDIIANPAPLLASLQKILAQIKEHGNMAGRESKTNEALHNEKFQNTSLGETFTRITHANWN